MTITISWMVRNVHQGYRGALIIEYEHDSPELMADVAKCVGFVEKTAGFQAAASASWPVAFVA